MDHIGICGTNPAAKPFLAALRNAGYVIRDLDAGDAPDGVKTLLLMARDLIESERLLFETKSYVRNLQGLETIIISGTLSPRYVRALRGRIDANIDLIDAPFVGTQRVLESGQCSFLLGGQELVLDRFTAFFAHLGHSAIRMGGFGTAMAAKALQDCLAAASSAMTRSAIDWANAQGIEETRLVSLLETTFGAGMRKIATDPASLVTNTVPGDNAGVTLVKNVESALDTALKGVHLNPPRGFDAALAAVRSRHLH